MADTKIAYESPDPERPATESPSLPDLEQEVHRHDPYAALRFRVLKSLDVLGN